MGGSEGRVSDLSRKSYAVCGGEDSDESKHGPDWVALAGQGERCIGISSSTRDWQRESVGCWQL